MNKIKVARLKRQITWEIETMYEGMAGLAGSTARHNFVHRQMERIEQCQGELELQLGTSQALCTVCELYISITSQLNSPCAK